MPPGKRACWNAAYNLTPRSSTQTISTQARARRTAYDHVWISDDVLNDVFNRFATATQAWKHQTRRGSHIPGPLEARRRLDKRRIAVVTPASRTTLDLWGELKVAWNWMTGRVPPMSLPRYQAHIEWHAPDILVGSRALGERTGALLPVALADTSKHVYKREADNNDSQLTLFDIALKGCKTETELSDCLQRQQSSGRLTEAQITLYLEHILAELEIIRPRERHVSPIMNNMTMEGLLSLFARQHGLQCSKSKRKLLRKVAVGIIRIRGATVSQVHDVLARLRDRGPLTDGSHDVLRNENVNHLAALGHALLDYQMRSGRDLDSLGGLLYEVRNHVYTHAHTPQQLVAFVSRLLRWAWPSVDRMQHSVNKYVTKYFELLQGHTKEGQAPASTSLSICHRLESVLIQGLAADNHSEVDVKSMMPSIIEVTSSLCSRSDANQMLPTWLSLMRDIDTVLQNPLELPLGKASATECENTLEYAAWDAVLSSFQTEATLQQLLPRLKKAHLAQLLINRALPMRFLDAAASDRLQLNSTSVETTFGEALRREIDLIGKLLPRSSVLATVRAIVLASRDKPDLHKSAQSAAIQAIYETYGAKELHLFLQRLSRAQITLYPGCLASIVIEVAKTRPQLAMALYRVRPVILHGHHESLMFALVDECAASDVFLLLRFSQPDWRVYDDISGGKQILRSLKPERVRLVHNLALRFAAAKGCTPRVAFRNVYTCYRYLKDNDASIGTDIARAFVHSYIIRSLQQNDWIKPERFIWILRFVRELEGEDAARDVDQTAYLWRERLAHLNLSTMKQRRRNGERLVWINYIHRTPYRKHGRIIDHREGRRPLMIHHRSRRRAWVKACDAKLFTRNVSK